MFPIARITDQRIPPTVPGEPAIKALPLSGLPTGRTLAVAWKLFAPPDRVSENVFTSNPTAFLRPLPPYVCPIAFLYRQIPSLCPGGHPFSARLAQVRHLRSSRRKDRQSFSGMRRPKHRRLNAPSLVPQVHHLNCF